MDDKDDEDKGILWGDFFFLIMFIAILAGFIWTTMKIGSIISSFIGA